MFDPRHYLGRAVCLLAVGLALGMGVYLLRQPKVPQNLWQQSFSVEYTKGAWVACLPRPEARVQVLASSADGVTVLEEEPNIGLVTKTPEGVAQCGAVGIVPLASRTADFFVPYAAIHSLKHGSDVVWRNAFWM